MTALQVIIDAVVLVSGAIAGKLIFSSLFKVDTTFGNRFAYVAGGGVATCFYVVWANTGLDPIQLTICKLFSEAPVCLRTYTTTTMYDSASTSVGTPATRSPGQAHATAEKWPFDPPPPTKAAHINSNGVIVNDDGRPLKLAEFAAPPPKYDYKPEEIDVEIALNPRHPSIPKPDPYIGFNCISEPYALSERTARDADVSRLVAVGVPVSVRTSPISPKEHVLEVWPMRTREELARGIRFLNALNFPCTPYGTGEVPLLQ
jgi:hypothetical protein